MAVKEIYSDFNKFNSLSSEADMLAVYDNSGNFKGYVDPRNYKRNLGTKLYTFGLFSDLHNNEGLTGSTTDNDEDMANAMNYYENVMHVDFIACCGDVFSTANNENMYKKFQQVKNANCPNTPFYSCSGNHDCATSTGGDGTVNDTYWNTYLGTSKSHVVTHAQNPSIPENDVLIFFGESYNKLNILNEPYTDDDINWLRTQLATYKNKRVLVFNHLFFPGTTDAQDAYVVTSQFAGRTLTKIASLAYMYPNSIWFNGHNHWGYAEQNGDKKANICNECEYSTKGLKMATQIHVSSCGSIREVNMNSGDKYHRNDINDSEGAIVEVYDNCIVHRAIKFKVGNGAYTNKAMPIAEYTIPFVNKQIPNWQIQEVTNQNQLAQGNVGSTTEDGSIEESTRYLLLNTMWDVDPSRKYFLAISRPVANRASSEDYTGNFGKSGTAANASNYNGLLKNTSDVTILPRLCRLMFHGYTSSGAYVGYLKNPKNGAEENYYFLDMTYFEDITDKIYGSELGNQKMDPSNVRKLRFRCERGSNNTTSVPSNISLSEGLTITKQITLISCTIDEWNAMNV